MTNVILSAIIQLHVSCNHRAWTFINSNNCSKDKFMLWPTFSYESFFLTPAWDQDSLYYWLMQLKGQTSYTRILFSIVWSNSTKHTNETTWIGRPRQDPSWTVTWPTFLQGTPNYRNSFAKKLLFQNLQWLDIYTPFIKNTSLLHISILF